MYRYGNPSVRKWARRSQSGQLNVESEAASYGGIAKKTLYFAALTLLIAIVSDVALWYGLMKFNTTDVDTLTRILTYLGIGVGVASIVMIVCTLVIAFVPSSTKICGTIYAVIHGAFLGLIAGIVDLFMPFVSLAALLGTVVLFVCCLLLNKSGVKLKGNVWRVMLAAFVSFVLIELVMFAISFFADVSGLFNWVQIVSCFLCIAFACITIVWDLQNVNVLVENGADKSYEWPVAFALVTSLVYLYIQILELLVRLAALFKNSKSK